VTDRVGLTPRERRALAATLYLAPIVLTLLAVALVRDMWPPFRQIAVMFFIGWLLAFLLDPVVSWLVERFPGLPRGPVAALTFVFVAGVTIVLSGLVALSFADSIAAVIAGGPSFEQALTDALTAVQSWATSLGLPLDVPQLVNDLVTSARDELGDILTGALGGGLTIVTMGTAIVFIAVVMVASKGRFLVFSRRLVPPDHLELYDALTLAIDRSFGGFIRGQFGLAFLYGLFVSVIALIFDVPFLPFIGVTTALLQTIPFFGQMVSWVPLVLATFVFTPDQLLPVVAIMAVGWLVMQNIVAPRVMGSAVGLNPLVVLAAVFLGGAIAGPLGAVFGVPVLAALASVFVVWLDHVRPPGSLPPPPDEIDVGHPAEAAQAQVEAPLAVAARETPSEARPRTLGHP
jgi:predicted PurR-regulated permease PerM